MIDYKRLNTAAPQDVEVTTDDQNAEMAALEEIVTQGEFHDVQLPKDRDPDGNFRFKIPGQTVGEFADFTDEIDDGTLSRLVEQWNEEAIAAAADEID